MTKTEQTASRSGPSRGIDTTFHVIIPSIITPFLTIAFGNIANGRYDNANNLKIEAARSIQQLGSDQKAITSYVESTRCDTVFQAFAADYMGILTLAAPAVLIWAIGKERERIRREYPAPV